MSEVLSLGRQGRGLLLRRPRTKALHQRWGCSQAGRVGRRGMKVGGFCKEGPGAERAGRRCLPEKGNQSRQLSGGPTWGHRGPHPGPGRVPWPAALSGPSVRGARAAPPSVVPAPAAAAPNTGRTGDASHADPAPLQVPLGRSLPPALCRDLPVLPCGAKLIWKEGLGRKICQGETRVLLTRCVWRP